MLTNVLSFSPRRLRAPTQFATNALYNPEMTELKAAQVLRSKAVLESYRCLASECCEQGLAAEIDEVLGMSRMRSIDCDRAQLKSERAVCASL